MTRSIISVKDVFKNYNIDYDNKRTLKKGLSDAIKRNFKKLIPRYLTNKLPERYNFCALSDITFDVEQGSKVAMLGYNGCGKSTLLNLLSGKIQPSSGKIRIDSEVLSPSDIQRNFKPDLTGRQIIDYSVSTRGTTQADFDLLIKEVIRFADLGRMLDMPVTHYSKGISMRLALTIAIFSAPNILVIDEELDIVDADFLQKCLTKLNDLTADKLKTVVLTSHNTALLQSFCDSGIYLKNGGLMAGGDIGSVVDQYLADRQGISQSFRPNLHKPIFFNALSLDRRKVSFNESVILKCEVISNGYYDNYFIGITINGYNNNNIGSIILRNTESLRKGVNEIKIIIPLKNIVPGNYKLKTSLSLDASFKHQDAVDNYPGFKITGELDQNHFILSKWQHSWGTHLMSEIDFLQPKGPQNQKMHYYFN